MATLGVTFLGSYLALRGGEKKTAQGPPINASSKDEETFIQYAVVLPSLADELLTYIQGLFEECTGRREESENEGMRYIIRKQKHDDRYVLVKAELHCTYWARKAETSALESMSISGLRGTLSGFTVRLFSNLSLCPDSLYSIIVSSYIPQVTQHLVLFTVLLQELCNPCCSVRCHATHTVPLVSRSFPN